MILSLFYSPRSFRDDDGKGNQSGLFFASFCTHITQLFFRVVCTLSKVLCAARYLAAAAVCHAEMVGLVDGGEGGGGG